MLLVCTPRFRTKTNKRFFKADSERESNAHLKVKKVLSHTRSKVIFRQSIIDGAKLIPRSYEKRKVSDVQNRR